MRHTLSRSKYNARSFPAQFSFLLRSLFSFIPQYLCELNGAQFVSFLQFVRLSSRHDTVMLSRINCKIRPKAEQKNVKHRQPPEAGTFDGHKNYSGIGHKVHSQVLFSIMALQWIMHAKIGFCSVTWKMGSCRLLPFICRLVLSPGIV